MHLAHPGLLATAVVVSLAVGPWLSRVAVRLASRDDVARPSAVRVAVTTALLAVLVSGAVVLAGARPATPARASCSARSTSRPTGCPTG